MSWIVGDSVDGFAFTGQPLDLATDELLHVCFTSNVELTTHACKLVGATFGNQPGKGFDMLFVD
jgi:hypothetical protein